MRIDKAPFPFMGERLLIFFPSPFGRGCPKGGRGYGGVIETQGKHQQAESNSESFKSNIKVQSFRSYERVTFLCLCKEK